MVSSLTLCFTELIFLKCVYLYIVSRHGAESRILHSLCAAQSACWRCDQAEKKPEKHHRALQRPPSLPALEKMTPQTQARVEER